MDGSVALLAVLRAAARASHRDTRAALREAGVLQSAQVRCVYLGQQSPKDPMRYVAPPAQWSVPHGARRSQAEVIYRWWLPDGESVLSAVDAHHARKQGVPAPWCAAVVLQHRLEEAAAEAQRQWQLTVKDRKTQRQESG